MLHGPRDTQRRAQRLRRTLTLLEVLLWQALRKRPAGLKFRRQHPAGRYILDFYCASGRLAVEVDGEAHQRGDRAERDALRDEWLVGQGGAGVSYSCRGGSARSGGGGAAHR